MNRYIIVFICSFLFLLRKILPLKWFYSLPTIPISTNNMVFVSILSNAWVNCVSLNSFLSSFHACNNINSSSILSLCTFGIRFLRILSAPPVKSLETSAQLIKFSTVEVVFALAFYLILYRFYGFVIQSYNFYFNLANFYDTPLLLALLKIIVLNFSTLINPLKGK